MITPYCRPCIYCRRIGGAGYACHYYLDNRRKLPCPTGDDCTERLMLTGKEREAYLAAHREPLFATYPTRDMIGDDFVWDSRGVIDGWYKI